MRLIDLFEDDYMQNLKAEIITLLTTVSAEGIDEVDTVNLLNDLEMQGYAVDEKSLLELLADIDIVATATADSIKISTSDVDMMVGDDAEEIEADTVNDLATNQATKDIGENTDEVYDTIARMRNLAGIEKR